MQKEQIGKFQYFTFMWSYIMANDIVRGIYYNEHKTNVWILVVSGFIFSFIIFYIYMFLYKNFNFINFDEIIFKIVGKFIGKILFVAFSAYALITVALNLRDLLELVQLFLIDQASLYILGFVFMVTVFYAINMSLEVIGRTNQMLFFFHLVFFFGFMYMVIAFNKENFENLVPVLDKGINPIIIDSLRYSYAVPLGELFAFIVLYQFLNEKKKSTKIPYLGILVAGLSLLVITLLNVIYLEPEANVVDYSPALRVSRIIDFQLFFQRMDLVVICLFTMHLFVKATVLIYLSKYLISKVVTIKKDHYITIVFCILILYMSINIVRNYNELIQFRKEVMFNITRLVMEIIIPFSVVFLSFFRKPKKKKKQNIKNNDNKNSDDDRNSNNENDGVKQQKNMLTKVKNKFIKKVLKKS